ncbi:MAG: TonB-dependent receptor [Acidobacteriia bacterium]|nr:TonB-dependent receptor [Terriglobia bacterium]
MMTHRLSGLLCFLFFGAALLAQSLTSLNGIVTDPSGSVVPKAAIVLVNLNTQATRQTTSDEAGRYSFAQVSPGNYRIRAKAQGFSDLVINDVALLVNTPTTVNLALKIGTLTQTIEVTAEAAQVNTTDASIGNAYGTRPILQLPLEARNVVGLLALQPGVAFVGENNGTSKNGSVNGGKSDQANVTLDGVDVNDQQNRSAFTSVLRVTLDSVQEFRVTTTNANADQGHGSGAQIALVTKSGTNEIHGSAYEFHRNTVTTANSFFNNLANLPKPKLLRNTFGTAVGGPIQKNHLFYFMNFEGRRDAKEGSVTRTVPTADFRNGIMHYLKKDNTIGTLLPADITALDPLHIGPNQAVMSLLKTYPQPNTTTAGDGYNTTGYRFIAPLPLRWNTYIARLDYSPDESGRHTFFVRGNLQNDRSLSLPQYPDQPSNSVNLNNSKGLAAGYNLLISPSLIASFRYGFTRQGVESSGTQTASYVNFLNLDDRYGMTTPAVRILPIHTLAADFSWNRGAHNIQFGVALRSMTNERSNYDNSFHYAQVRATRLNGAGKLEDPADINSKGTDVYRAQVVNLLGVISTGTAHYNYDLAGNVQPVGAPVVRNFILRDYSLYLQDTWRVNPGLSLSAGLRWELAPPIHERDGLQISLSPSLGSWFDARGALADQGKSDSAVTPLSYIPTNSPGGSSLYKFYKKEFAPRLGVAYSPRGTGGILGKIFGGPGATSIRAGWGMYYENLGNTLIMRADAGGQGLQTSVQTAGSQFDEATGPRWTGWNNVPSVIVPAAPKQTFPIVAPNIFTYGGAASNIDSQVRPAYTMNLNFSLGREFKNGLFIQGSYVGRLSRRSLAQVDVATPVNLIDPDSGMTYWEAATILTKLARAKTPQANVPKVSFWENLWPAAATPTLSATQAVYTQFVAYPTDTASALEKLDSQCRPTCSRLGAYALYNPQFASFTAWRSIAGGNYHAMQWTARQRFSKGLEFTFNFTWSKSIDLTSRAESDGTGSTYGFITNPWVPGQHKAVSDYDMTHQWNLNGVWELPVGTGHRFLNQGGVLEVLLGGWQISGLYRQSSGLPISVRDGSNWPTNYQWQGWATMIAAIPGMQTTKNAPSVSGASGPNLFADPKAAVAAFDFTLPGELGNRNILRGDGYFTIDVSIGKRFRMPYSEKHSLQFRWETFNLTNTARFDVGAVSVNLGSQANFGKYSDTLTQPRVMQFGLRYEF